MTTENPGSPPLIDPVERKAIHAYLTERSHSSIHDFCSESGVSVSGLLEAIGEAIPVAVQAEDADDNPVLYLDEIVKRSRKVDAERRRRGR